MAFLQPANSNPPLELISVKSEPEPASQDSKRSRSKGKKSSKHKRPKMVRFRSCTPTQTRTETKFKKLVPRKLGPRDMGRNKYPEGTKRYDDNTGYFLDEKIHRRAKSNAFFERKRRNPVLKRATVAETGTPNDWKKPDYYKEEVAKMYAHHNGKRHGWGGTTSVEFLVEKPWKPKDSRLDALKNQKIPKGQSVSEYDKPFGWRPINYKYENAGGGFLDEKFWFEASHVKVDGGLSKLIEALPPQQKLKLRKMPAPTGYRTKINFLKTLRGMVVDEVKRLNQEDSLLNKLENEVFIDGMSREIAQDFEKQIGQALDEVLAETETDANKSQLNENETVALNTHTAADQKEEDKFEDFDSLSDTDDAATEDDQPEPTQSSTKYKLLKQQSTSHLGQMQRKLLTMKSVNKLTEIIDDIEDTAAN